jgi:hypothetical protein
MPMGKQRARRDKALPLLLSPLYLPPSLPPPVFASLASAQASVHASSTAPSPPAGMSRGPQDASCSGAAGPSGQHPGGPCRALGPALLAVLDYLQVGGS